MGWISDVLPTAMVRPEPALQLAEPELRLVPNDRGLGEVGWNREDLGQVVRAIGDGLYVGEHFDGDQRMNIILRANSWQNPEELASLPILTPSGITTPLSQLVTIERTVGPTQLKRVDRRRTITLRVDPSRGYVTRACTVCIAHGSRTQRSRRRCPPDGNLLYGGSADSLRKAIVTMSKNFGMALVVLFLLMSVLFGSPRDSLMVTLSMPLAMVGGVLALRILNLITFQPLDLLTMIGFVILLGLVVNNAILLAHQTRSTERAGLSRHDAVEQALRLRLRPIFMSTLTSVFGMLPLLLMPGAGSVIYRGLATVIVGGMSVSTIFTLLLLPALLRLGASRQPARTEETAVAANRPLRSVA